MQAKQQAFIPGPWAPKCPVRAAPRGRCGRGALGHRRMANEENSSLGWGAHRGRQRRSEEGAGSGATQIPRAACARGWVALTRGPGRFRFRRRGRKAERAFPECISWDFPLRMMDTQLDRANALLHQASPALITSTTGG